MLVLIIVTCLVLYVPVCWVRGHTAYPYRLIDLQTRRPNDRLHTEHLLCFHKVAQEVGLAYWVSEGSALGLARSGNLIPGDSDVDVGIYESEIERLERVVDIMVERHGFRVWRNYPLSIGKDRSYIDIDITGKGLPCMAVEWPEPCDNHMAYLEPFDTIQYHDQSFTVPNTQYLVHLYGSDWEVPKPGFKPSMVDRTQTVHSITG